MVKCYPETLGGAALDRPAPEGTVTQTVETDAEAGAGLDLRTDAQKDLARPLHPRLVDHVLAPEVENVAVTTRGPLPREKTRKGEQRTDIYRRAEMMTADIHRKEGTKSEPGPQRDGAERDATPHRGTLRQDTPHRNIPPRDILLPGIPPQDTRPLEATAGGIETTERSSGHCLGAAKKPGPPLIKEVSRKPSRKNRMSWSRPPRRCWRNPQC